MKNACYDTSLTDAQWFLVEPLMPEFAHWVKERRPKAAVEVVRRCDQMSGFHVLPRRWVIERTFGWLCQHRRLVRDYEKTTRSARAWILVAMTRTMRRRLA